MSKNFIERFADLVEKNPHHIAVLTDGNRARTYRQIYDQAGGIAGALHAQGVRPGEIVALHIEKSADYIAAQLGCWMAGAAFLPLDPTLPSERRNFILSDSGVNKIISRQAYESQIHGNSAQILNIEDIDQKTSLPQNFNYSAQIDDPEQLAYVIYTSGSTGKPKGVMVPHRGICNFLDEQIKAFQLGPDSRSLFYLSTSFDASISDIWTALRSGSTLCIETLSAVETAAQLNRIVRDREISYMDIPPSLLRLMNPAEMPACLKTVTIGGEPCPPDIVRNWAQRLRLVNVYGPTEATVCTSYAVCDAQNWDKPRVGQPMANVDYIVVDRDMNPVPAGQEGELLIGGIQLALGYLNRPELTAKKFIDLDGRKYYRTGDLVVNDPAQGHVFLGRIDRQIKLRGQLIELEEVEAAILKNPDVAQAAVVKRAVNPDDKDSREALVAFLTLKDPGKPAPDLKKDLVAALPKWMIPGKFVTLDQMPLTTTQKIDLQALVNLPLEAAPGTQSDHELSSAERLLIEIWQRVLKLKGIGPQEDFFDDLGGDSFALLQLSLEAELHGLNLTPNIVNEYRTIAAIGQWLRAHKNDAHVDMATAGAAPAEDLKRDVAMDDEWRELIGKAKTLPTAPKKPGRIFFTGATGFLGPRLMHDMMMADPDTVFYTLVRAADEKAAMERLGAAFARHDVRLTPDLRRRIVPVCGDFSQKNFGLSQDKWDDLAVKTDTVVHCGATVNMVLPYESLRAANVGGVQEVARLAMSGQRKKLHYASTLSVFVSTDQNTGVALETDRLENTKTIYGGYGQTKWAAEYFLHQIPHEALDASIHRLGLITGDTRTGAGSPKDFISMFMHGVTALGCVPEGEPEKLEVDVTPIDYCAAAMSHIILHQTRTQPDHEIYHIANDKGFNLGMILDALRERSHDIPVLSAADWQERMAGSRHEGFTPEESAAYLGLGRLLPDAQTFERHRTIDLFQATGIVFDQRNTRAALAGTGLACPAASRNLLQIYLDYIMTIESSNKDTGKRPEKDQNETAPRPYPR